MLLNIIEFYLIGSMLAVTITALALIINKDNMDFRMLSEYFLGSWLVVLAFVVYLLVKGIITIMERENKL